GAGVLQAALSYSAKDANGYYLPGTEAINALKQETNGTWTETQSDGVQFRYDASGALLWVSTPGGGRTSVTYSSLRPQALIGPFGRRVTVTYDAGGKLKRITDAGGRLTSYVWGA